MKAQIYTGTSRKKLENDWFRRLSFFDFNEYFRSNFGLISIFHEETLGANRTKDYNFRNGSIVIVPMIGAIIALVSEDEITLSPGEVLSVDASELASVSNPYHEEQVNYLIIRVDGKSEKKSPNSIEEKRNVLQKAFEFGETKGFLGMFDGREKGEFKTSVSKGIFVFVINGAFEFDDRLLETRDALGISESEDHEFEALSGNAILLVIETKVS